MKKLIILDVIAARWRLFGHILRLAENTPAQMDMTYYFSPRDAKKFCGRQKITLPTSLHNDINSAKMHDEKFSLTFPTITGLKSSNDLLKLKVIAQNRISWKILSGYVYLAAEAAAYKKLDVSRKDC